MCIRDRGGDDDGAVALGRYHAQFAACPADVYFVVNPFRPRTSTVEQALCLMEAVERRARLAITGLAVNANLGAETSAEELLAGRAFIERLAEKSGLPVAFEAGLESALEELPERWPRLPIRRYLTPESVSYTHLQVGNAEKQRGAGAGHHGAGIAGRDVYKRQSYSI